MSVSMLGLGCGAPAGNSTQVNSNAANRTDNLNTNINVNSNAPVANSSGTSTDATVETAEPEMYQATVTLRLESIGTGQQPALPNLIAKVARGANSRRMEFTMPAGGRVVFLDKAGTNYLILPDKRQYAVLDKESLGFDVRRMLMPEQIVGQIKSVSGVERVGEEKFNGRDAVKYRYAATANTQTKAGEVATESYLFVDKQTGLPLRSETVTQTKSGANVQGVSGLRIVTEMNDIRSDAPDDLFAEPTALEKIDSAQVRAQVDVVFSALASLLGQALRQVQ